MKTKVDSLEDIIFENRNKDYGAYELRRKYSKRGTIALGIALIIVSFAVGVPLIAGIMNKMTHYGHFKNTGGYVISEIPKEKPKVELPKLLPQIPKVKEFIFKIPKIVEEITNSKDDFEPNDFLTDLDFKGSIDTSSHVMFIDKPKERGIDVDPTVFESFAIQEKPVYPGGDVALIKYVSENTIYPVISQDQGIEGTVYIRFVVTKTGNVGQAAVMRSVDPLLDEEALRVVKTLPKWEPGKNNGNPVNVWFIIPVKFKLQKQ